MPLNVSTFLFLPAWKAELHLLWQPKPVESQYCESMIFNFTLVNKQNKNVYRTRKNIARKLEKMDKTKSERTLTIQCFSLSVIKFKKKIERNIILLVTTH